jgi:hypothetical protein
MSRGCVHASRRIGPMTLTTIDGLSVARFRFMATITYHD